MKTAWALLLSMFFGLPALPQDRAPIPPIPYTLVYDSEIRYVEDGEVRTRKLVYLGVEARRSDGVVVRGDRRRSGLVFNRFVADPYSRIIIFLQHGIDGKSTCQMTAAQAEGLLPRDVGAELDCMEKDDNPSTHVTQGLLDGYLVRISHRNRTAEKGTVTERRYYAPALGYAEIGIETEMSDSSGAFVSFSKRYPVEIIPGEPHDRLFQIPDVPDVQPSELLKARWKARNPTLNLDELSDRQKRRLKEVDSQFVCR